jgi:hypothetical protein
MKSPTEQENQECLVAVRKDNARPQPLAYAELVAAAYRVAALRLVLAMGIRAAAVGELGSQRSSPCKGLSRACPCGR